MAGIYIHIPFCKKACHYCNFHFSTNTKYTDEMVDCIIKELHLRKDYLNNAEINTIYFGGGTPSILPTNSLKLILSTVSELFLVNKNAEITIEANPDDISELNLKEWFNIGINRLSVGIQSFFEEDLKFMNRAHNSNEAKNALELIEKSAFTNYSLDLIFGYPILSDGKLLKNIETAMTFHPPHISAYALSVEPNTALENMIAKQKTAPINEEQAGRQMLLVMEELTKRGFEHYEISNYAQPNQQSEHNSAYWKGVPYLGIGPGAHSFNGINERSWNISHNPNYIKNIQNDLPFYETELLSRQDLYNEFLMIGLRKSAGINLAEVEIQFPEFNTYFLEQLNESLKSNLWNLTKNQLTLTKEGKLISDQLICDLFVV